MAAILTKLSTGNILTGHPSVYPIACEITYEQMERKQDYTSYENEDVYLTMLT